MLYFQALLSCLGDIVGKLFVKEELIVSLLSKLYKLPGNKNGLINTTTHIYYTVTIIVISFR